MDGKIPLPLMPNARVRLRSLLLAPLLLLAAWVVGNEWSEYQEVKARYVLNATRSGESFANLIGTRLNNQFREMSFLSSLIDRSALARSPDERLRAALSRFTALNPSLVHVNLIGSDGVTRLWSVLPTDNPPLVPPQAYTPIASEPGWLLGQDVIGHDAREKVLTLRYRFVLDVAPYFISSPYRIDALLDYQPDSAPPYYFAVQDDRDGSLLGVWYQNRVEPANQPPPALPVISRVPVPGGFPLTILVQCNTDQISAQYWQNAHLRWLIYFVMLVLLTFAERALSNQMRGRVTALRQAERLAQFNGMMAEASQAQEHSADEAQLLQELCQLAVTRGGMALAYVAKPDADGWFNLLATAGRTEYTLGLKLSTDPKRPEGRGTAGRAWQSGEVFFNQDFLATRGLELWAERAQQFGFSASATLPIHKQGALWGVFSVYHTQKNIFDEPLRTAIGQLARQISLGLQWLDTRAQEQHTHARQRSLLHNTLAGIAMVRDRRLVEVNPRLADMLGFANPAALIGQPTRILYADDAQYARVGALYPQVLAHGSAQLEDLVLRHQDGRLLYADIAGSLIEDSAPNTSVWTLQDVTRRHALQADLTELAEFQRTLFDANAAALFLTTQDGQFIDANPAFCRLTGNSCVGLAGQSARLLTPAEAPPFTLRLAHDSADEKSLLHHRLHRTQPILHRDGRRLIVEVLGAILHIPGHGLGVLWNLVDVTELHEAQRAVTHQATHDALTGLANRRALDAFLPKAIARARRRGGMVAVGMLDLDDFKPINDTWGHAAGDLVLIALAKRLQDRLRTEDLLARLGGDEFVIVLEELEPSRVQEQLSIALDRLYDAVRSPFDLGEGHQASIGMSLGIALFPLDGEEGDALLRHADAALYAVKQNKHSRARWWQLSQSQEGMARPDPIETHDAYGGAAAHFLAQHQTVLAGIAPAFVRQFYELLAYESAAQAILSTLTTPQMQHLVLSQTEHLLFLTAPETDRDALLARSEQVGRVHSLVGVNSALLIRSISLYRRLLIEHLGRTALSTRDRYRLMMLIETRVEDDLLSQAQAGSGVIQQYFSTLTRPLPAAGCLWNDALPEELGALHQAPGITAALCVRRGDETTAFIIEAALGAAANAFGHALTQVAVADGEAPARYQATLLSSFAQSGLRSLRNERWSLAGESGTATVHSALFIPIHDRNRLTVGVVVLLGAFPHQFESVWAQQFAGSSQLRLSQIWQACTGPQLFLDHQLAEQYRQQLFAGGLRMYAQPIIDLASGQVVKVEALARLALADGEMLSPQNFVPLLGDADLDRLFQRMLDESLAALRRWDESGIRLDIAVNLPPGTLRDRHCPDWVRNQLHAHGIAPDRLTLELLENDMDDSADNHQAIHALRALGVPLAMDDLGAGYSSLNRLASLPFSSIKIDQALFARLRHNPIQTLSLISAIIQMGRDFELQVVVEGLEDAGAIEAARLLGAGFGQGYGIARPMPLDDIPAWIRQQPAEPMPTPSPIKTAAGALAYHWWYLHNHPGSHHCGSAEDCPLHAFLLSQGANASDALHWHAAIHDSPQHSEASRKLMAWLAGLL